MIRTGKKFSKPDLSRVINGDTEVKEDDKPLEKFRLDHLLVEQHPEYNRATLQTFIKSGFVIVDGTVVTKPSAEFERSATITLTLPAAPTDHPTLPVIYEDDHVLVLDKPSGLLSTAKGEYCPEPTLEDFGLLVHRLDRDTSGVVILAKDEATQSMLRRQFQERKTHKTYYAITTGIPKHEEALIDLPIARNMKHPTTFIVDAGGKASETHYRIIQTAGNHALLELKPTTGRTHQLRVHLNYLGTPISGDPVYGESDAPRLMLHAGALEITIPGPAGGDNVRRTFTSPLPPEFKEYLEG